MKFKKLLKITALVAGSLFLVAAYFYTLYPATKEPAWGINFSPNQARYLGLDARQTFINILLDLRPKKIRLVAYWENLEPQQGKFDFKETADLLSMAEKTGSKVTLVLGKKQPRWPECHVPDWAAKMPAKEQRQALFDFIKAVIGNFKNYADIERWQVENEAFFNYGKDCQVASKEEVQEEIALVRSLDSRPIVLTDSGEKGGWLQSASIADIFGTTMYRRVHNPRWGGYITYPLPPAWYRVRAGIVKYLYNKNVIDVETQAEPWFNGDFSSISLDDQLKLMNADNLSDNLNYAKNTGLSEHYLWGVEWWYWMKQHGHPEYWEIAKKTFIN